MQISIRKIADAINGKIIGNADQLVDHPAKIEEAKKGAICFVARDKYYKYIAKTEASAYLVQDDFDTSPYPQKNFIKVKDVYQAVSVLLSLYNQQDEIKNPQISTLADIHPTAKIGENVSIGSFVVIKKHAIIGDNVSIDSHAHIGTSVNVAAGSKIYSGVKIYHGCKIGMNCIVHANAVIGSDGFGFARKEDGTFEKIPQVGIVRIDDEVEIGASCTIDRATMGETVIMHGAKLDNLVHIAHNVVIGKHTVIAAQVGIAGSTKIGNNCMIGGQAGIVGHLEIADGTIFQAKSGMTKSVKESGTKWYGYPAIEYNNYLRSFAIFKNLPEIRKRINQLEEKHKERDSKG